MKPITDLKLAVSVAFTHMRARLKQTLVAMAGVAFGITTFIFLLGMIKGIQAYTQAMVFEQSPHVHLFNQVGLSGGSLSEKAHPGEINVVHHRRPKAVAPNLKDGLHTIAEIRRDPRVQAAAGSIVTQVFYRLGSLSVNGQVNGIDFEASDRLFQLSDKLMTGSFEELSTIPNSLVMGVGLARKLNVQVGDHLELTTEKGDNFSVKIIGIFKTGLTAIDDQQSYASLKTAQRFLGVPNSYITDIKVMLQDSEMAAEVSREFQERYAYSGSNWKIDNATFLQGYVLQNMIAYGVAVVILLVAGFGIFNILTMMTYEKMKDIAILKATGFSNRDVRRIFMTQALCIGMAGAVSGLIFGYLASYALSKMPYHTDVMITLDHLPVSFNPLYYVTGFCFGLLTTALAGYLPSRKAAKVDPITILRG